MVTYILIGTVISNWIAFILASTFQCSPVEYQWNKKISGHCFDVQTYYKFVNVPNILTDAVMLYSTHADGVAPKYSEDPQVWFNPSFPNRKCVSHQNSTLGEIFCSYGELHSAIVCSCIRLVVFCGTEALKDNTCKSLHRHFLRGSALTSHRLKGASVSLVSWSVVEPGMYLIAACLPALRPLCAQLVPKSIRSRFSSHSTRNTVVPLEDLPFAAHSAFAKPRANDDSVLYHEHIGFDDISPAEMETGETDEEKGMVRRKDEAAPARDDTRTSSTNHRRLT